MKNIFLIILASLLLFSSCKNTQKKENVKEGKIITLEHAKLFDIQKTDNYSLIRTYNHEGKSFCSVLIIKNDSCKNLPKADFVIHHPIKTIAILSSTHIGYLEAIDQLDLITGSSNPYRFYNKKLYKKYQEGKIVNIGDDMKCNIEEMIALKPDVIFTTGYEYNYNLKNILLKASIPFIPVSEWKESTILGRTEWVKFFGTILNKEAKADSIYKKLEKNYTELKTLTKNLENKPTVLWGSNFKGTWYMPGGQSYMGQMLTDAGANYHFKQDSTRGSIHMNIENVIETMQNADFWLSPSAYSIKELYSQDKHYHIFKALKNKNVFNYDKRMNPKGFNDYWESGIMHPDIILKDIIHILHPQLFKDYEMYFFHKLPEISKFKREY
jgi:iron complex transport system substrate-binding protein